MSGSRKVFIFVISMLVFCLASALVEGQTHTLRHFMDDVLYDNWNHYLPCEKLPGAGQVEQVLHEHAGVLEAIAAVHPGHAGVDVDTMSCPGKADLVIWYGSHRDRLEIERILGGETFYGVPYRLNNR